ncbi:alpha/beta hydrolase fold domain-containing protein [Staphylococcus durrellii]|uniref:alpha/beta hydrolase fold domain-containing protein n=1 Tax=Staphylococcus durrellii TaxID=2781773 RepID=UPI0018A0E991|nr:alpha/beta hydrolase [Staphylococcus durrellii]MBF7016367.1 alpha/beta hydrolase [Staphylococcus durrellii]
MTFNIMNYLINKYLVPVRTINFDDEKQLQQFMNEREKLNAQKHKQPESLNIKSNLEKQMFEDMQVFRFNFRHNNKRKILYLHGGYNVLQPSIFHWRFMDKLALNTLYEIVMPIYPKAPTNNVEDTYKAIHALYQQLVTEVGEENIVVMGDGSGGSLALSFVQQLNAEGHLLPKKVYLLSPLLDAELKNEQITDDLINKDKLVHIEGVRDVMNVWSSDHALKDAKISPINGDIKHLPPIYVFGSTQEVYYPDMLKLVKLGEGYQLPIHFYPYKRMIHGFPLYPVRQSHKVVRQIVQSLKV